MYKIVQIYIYTYDYICIYIYIIIIIIIIIIIYMHIYLITVYIYIHIYIYICMYDYIIICIYTIYTVYIHTYSPRNLMLLIFQWFQRFFPVNISLSFMASGHLFRSRGSPCGLRSGAALRRRAPRNGPTGERLSHALRWRQLSASWCVRGW